MTNDQFKRWIAIAKLGDGVDSFPDIGEVGAYFVFPNGSAQSESGNSGEVEVINHPEDGTLYVNASIEFGYKEIDALGPRRLGFNSVQVIDGKLHSSSPDFDKAVNGALENTGMKLSDANVHVHGASLYIHPDQRINPHELRETINRIAHVARAIRNAVDASRRRMGVTEEEDDEY